MSIELHPSDNRPSGLQLDLHYRPLRAAPPRMFLHANRPQHVPAYRVPEVVVREVAEWDRDLRMLLLEGVAVMLLLVAQTSGAASNVTVASAAGASLLGVLTFWIGMRWFALINRPLGAFLAFFLACVIPPLVGVVNTALYHLAPPLFRWRVIALAWCVGTAVAFGLAG